MKRIICVFMMLLVLVITCACGAKEETSQPAVTASPAPQAETREEKTTELPAEAPQQETEQPEEATEAQQTGNEQAEAKDIAYAMIDQNVQDLYDAIGEPLSAEYSKSCNGPGDDGMLTYDGFIVFTYRENGQETVFDVLD